jgi:hypothetical protein
MEKVLETLPKIGSAKGLIKNIRGSVKPTTLFISGDG